MEKRIAFIIDIFFYGALTAGVILVFRFVVPLFWPFLGGLALAYLFKQVSRSMRIRGGAPVAVIAVFLSVTTVSALPLIPVSSIFFSFYSYWAIVSASIVFISSLTSSGEMIAASVPKPNSHARN